jgi:hypothetical protein
MLNKPDLAHLPVWRTKMPIFMGSRCPGWHVGWPHRSLAMGPRRKVVWAWSALPLSVLTFPGAWSKLRMFDHALLA